MKRGKGFFDWYTQLLRFSRESMCKLAFRIY